MSENSWQRPSRGHMIPIGGAEDKNDDSEILHRFVRLCGAGEAHIAIIPTASRRHDTGKRYERVFAELGAGSVSVMTFRSRADCKAAEHLETLDRVQGIFMTGGNQVRLAKTLRDTPIAEKIVARHAEGLHVAGTSAGAAFMPKHMIAGGVSGSTPHTGIVKMAPGLGLTERLVIDQHFRQRERLGRLLMALTYSPRAIGIGIDEDTAAFVGPDDTLEVVGSGGITIVDAANLEHNAEEHSLDNAPVSMIGLQLHVLASGGVYDLETRAPRLAIS